MRTVFSMWKYTRMIVLIAVCAVVYAVAISVLQTPPPFTTRFIGQLMPMPLSLLFGPAAGLGVAIGDTISGLITGTVRITTLFGFFGNFLLGFLPYALWTRLRPLARGDRETTLNTLRQWVLYIVIAVGSALACAVVVAWPIHMLGINPFSFTATLIGVQDAIVGSIASILLLLVYPRIKSLGLVWWEVMDTSDLDEPNRTVGIVGAWLVLVAAVVSYTVGVWVFPSSASIIGGLGTLLIILGAILMW